jgi:hypothetical protein
MWKKYVVFLCKEDKCNSQQFVWSFGATLQEEPLLEDLHFILFVSR